MKRLYTLRVANSNRLTVKPRHFQQFTRITLYGIQIRICIQTILDDDDMQYVLIFCDVFCGISFNLMQTNRENAIQKKMSRVAFEVHSLCLLHLSETYRLHNNTIGTRTSIELFILNIALAFYCLLLTQNMYHHYNKSSKSNLHNNTIQRLILKIALAIQFLLLTQTNFIITMRTVNQICRFLHNNTTYVFHIC